MGRFFANQKLDEAGIVGITLQKLLIFFMILDVATLFCGYSFLGAFMSLLFHFIVFMGVYRRRTCVLLTYVVIHVIVFVLGAIALILVVSSLMYINPDQGYDNNSSSADVPPVIHNSTFNYDGVRQLFSRSFSSVNHTTVHPTPMKNSTKVHPTPHTPPASSSEIPQASSAEVDVQGVFFLGIVLLLLSVVILYTKILSVVLAHRMRKILLAGSSGLPVSRSTTTETDAQKPAATSEPIYVPSEDYENSYPLFNQPGFMPYQPMMQAPQNFYPGQAPHMQHPFMYGQQPVFYTFAPMPQQQPESNENEKL